MAVKLNLLPEDYALTEPVRQLVKIARSLNVILLSLFFVVVLGMGGYFIFSSISLKNVLTENSNLKSKIQAQSVAQQQIVLLKDRLSKIKTVQNIPDISKNLKNIDPILSLISERSFLSELSIDSQKTSTSIVFRSNADLTNFLKGIEFSNNYSSISLGNFNYSPTIGYQVNINFTGK